MAREKCFYTLRRARKLYADPDFQAGATKIFEAAFNLHNPGGFHRQMAAVMNELPAPGPERDATLIEWATSMGENGHGPLSPGYAAIILGGYEVPAGTEPAW